MTDTILTDDIVLETSATDIRVFGKWSGADVQISDMSLEVYLFYFILLFELILLSYRIISLVQNNLNFFPIQRVVIK
jgi:hypothetical protein